MPALAVQLLKSPINPTGQAGIPVMSDFMWYANDLSGTGIPLTAAQYYNYLQSKWKYGAHLTRNYTGYGGTVSANYAFPSSPDSSGGWSICGQNVPGADRRMICSAGPFNLQPGAYYPFDFAVIYDSVLSAYPSPSFAGIHQKADEIRSMYPFPACNGILSDAETPVRPMDRIYPTLLKAGETLTIASADMISYRLLSPVGSVIRDEAPTQGEKAFVLTGSLSPGMYFIRIKHKNGSFCSLKVIVN